MMRPEDRQGGPRFIAIVCGLKSEAAAVRAALGPDAGRFRIGVSGANAARAEAIAREFAQAGAVAILSVGVSGGLDPALRPGDLIVTSAVIADPPLVAHPPLLPPFQGEESSGPGAVPPLAERELGSGRTGAGPVYGSDVIIQTAEEKAALFMRTGAVAVDMESHGAARAAAAAGLPFVAIRAIADPASRALPGAAMDAVAPDGSTRVLATLLKCVKDPGDFPALLQLGADSDEALKTLRGRVGGLFGGLLLRLDL